MKQNKGLQDGPCKTCEIINDVRLQAGGSMMS